MQKVENDEKYLTEDQVLFFTHYVAQTIHDHERRLKIDAGRIEIWKSLLEILVSYGPIERGVVKETIEYLIGEKL